MPILNVDTARAHLKAPSLARFTQSEDEKAALRIIIIEHKIEQLHELAQQLKALLEFFDDVDKQQPGCHYRI